MFLSVLLLAQANWITSANSYVYQTLNGMAGQSWIFDHLLGLGLSSNLVKAAVIGACFMFAWLSGEDRVVTAARRKVLLITLISSVFVLGATKTISKAVFLPRPYVLSEKTFHLENDQLVETPRVNFNVPFDDDIEKSYKQLQTGEIVSNDLESFPSDHAGFFLCIAVGIFLAYRTVGLIALLWAIFVPLAAKVILGQHSPIDIVVGAGVGIGILLVMQAVLGRFAGRVLDPVVRWTMNNSAMAAALMFIVLFEITNTLDDVREVGKVGKEVAKHMMGRP
jgi:undecaprenyl-diphosphatase